ncbi:hypothetical protein LTR86_005029 [Recurvomyces mirabilis]|nr:hypothetical protein LTR86_005029 [Recurvomyces mirabilis]
MVANGTGAEMATGGTRDLQTKAMPAQPTRVTGLTAKPPGPNALYSNSDKVHGDWRDDLIRDGYVVIKGAVPADRAANYRDDMLSYLESFAGGQGFKRDDPATVLEKHLPIMNEKGMILGYGAQHEQFCWDIRSEPGVVHAFTTIYDTDDLMVSFDSMNMQWPNRKDAQPNTPWPHQDQHPETWNFRCMQGLVNVFPNGSNDGGLIVCKGAHKLTEEFHNEFRDEVDKVWSWTPEWYGFTKSGMEWLEKKGLEWVKPCAEPGDLILWDSRTPHYNLPPTGESPRFCTYVCMGPLSDVSQEQLRLKKEAFGNCRGTTHWPQGLNIIPPGAVPVKRNGEECPHNTWQPRKKPVLNDVAWRLTGIPYIQMEA